MSGEAWNYPRRAVRGDCGATRRGIALAVLSAIISGIAVFVAGYGVKEFPSPAAYTALRNAFVGLILLALLFRPSALSELRRLTPGQGLGLALLGIVGGSIPFVLFFEGLSRAGSGNAAIIQKTLFIWVALLAILFLRERLGRGQVIALGLLLVSQIVLGGSGAVPLGSGAVLVLIATLVWSVEVVLAKRLLDGMSGSLAATARMAIGGAILLCYLASIGKLGIVMQLNPTQWAWVIGPGLLLLAYVTTWYAALKRASATAVTSVLTVGAPITAVLTALAGSGPPRSDVLFGYGILVVAVLLVAVMSRGDAVPRALNGREATRGGA